VDLQDLLDESAEHAKSKGFDPTFPEFIALAHSELSEALEEFRKGKGLNETYIGDDDNNAWRAGKKALNACKPEGIPPELADVVIRIAHYCGVNDIDLVGAIQTKLAFNKTRPHMHGKIL
jgi:NTP pyrophosphatase (non-canonical NTP hydrolase)